MRYALDLAASSVRLHTRAEGVLARFAHDLELLVPPASGQVVREGARWTGELTFRVADARVVGVLRGERVDRGVLSAKDVAEIERKLRDEVLLGPEVRVRGEGDLRLGTLTVAAPKGTETVTFAPTADEEPAGRLEVRARTRLSLRKLGCPEVKAPLGAFKVADVVEVEARLLFVA